MPAVEPPTRKNISSDYTANFSCCFVAVKLICDDSWLSFHHLRTRVTRSGNGLRNSIVEQGFVASAERDPDSAKKLANVQQDFQVLTPSTTSISSWPLTRVNISDKLYHGTSNSVSDPRIVWTNIYIEELFNNRIVNNGKRGRPDQPLCLYLRLLGS